MAVTIGEYWPGRKTRYRADFNREHARVFRATTDNVNTDGVTVLAALATAGVERGVVHPNDADAFCSDVEASNDPDDRFQWTLTATYSTLISESQTSPTTRPTLYTWTTEYVERGAGQDLDGTAIENSAHETFEQPGSFRAPVQVCKAVCTRASFLQSIDYWPFIDRVNSVGVIIDGLFVLPGQGLLDDLNVEMAEEQGAYFRKFNYTFKVRSDLYSSTSKTLLDAVIIGVNVVPISSTAGVVIGSELVVDSGVDEETVYVTAVGVGTITATFTKTHVIDTPAVLHTYNPWQYQPLDMGFNEWDDGIEDNVDIFTASGHPIAHPVFLDGAGRRLPTWAGSPPDPVRLLFRTRNSANFNGITFP